MARRKVHHNTFIWRCLKFCLISFGLYAGVTKFIAVQPIIIKLALYGGWRKITEAVTNLIPFL